MHMWKQVKISALAGLAGTTILMSQVYAKEIPYRAKVNIGVGQSITIHGARGNCGEAPPNWSRVKAQLPKISVASYADGGVGTRVSNKCGGPTPARAIIVIGKKAGTESIVLYGDPITITVK